MNMERCTNLRVILGQGPWYSLYETRDFSPPTSAVQDPHRGEVQTGNECSPGHVLTCACGSWGDCSCGLWRGEALNTHK